MKHSLAAALLLCAAVSAETVRDGGELKARQRVQRESGPGIVDVFTVAATEGQLLRVVVRKLGVNVFVKIKDSVGKDLLTAARPTGLFGRESALVVTSRPGAYQVRVEKADDSSESGRYTITLQDLDLPRRRRIHWISHDGELAVGRGA